MTRWLIAIGAALLTALGGWLMLLNPDPVRVQLTSRQVVELPLAAALIAAFALGALIVTLLTSTRGLSRRVARWRARRVHRKLAREAATTAHARSLVWAGAYGQARAELGLDGDDVPADAERVELAAESYLGDDDLTAARTLLDRAIARLGPQPRLIDLLSQTAQRSGDLPGAIAALEQLRPTLTTSPRLARRLRDLYIAVDRIDDALHLQSDLLLGVSRGPALAREELALAGLRYARICRETDPRRAARRLAALAREAPDFVPAWVAAGDRWLAAGRPFFARRVWERGVLRQPAQPLLDRLEALHRTTSRPDRTARLYQRLERTHRNDPLVMVRKVRHHLAADQLDAAAEQLAGFPPALTELPATHLLRAELLRRRGDLAAAGAEAATVTEQCLGSLAHGCQTCGARHEGWADRCSACGAWGSLRAALPTPA